MKYEYDDQKEILTIYPEGRIDSDNAAVFGQELDAARRAYPDGRIVFDMDRLDYLSSAGLRVFLNLAQK